MKQLGFYRLEDADTWSAKTTPITRGEPFYLYGNDINRGLDIYRFDWDAEESASKGQWLTPAQELERTTRLSAGSTDIGLVCLLAQ
jgi:hypothetical protein